ncbi:adenosylmethionine--8-amino-7-oxononanoate transaminase [Paracoccus sp. MC1862]|uniref:adenosylmethionine--8-amino-7-oxononanoate transaminase n=1 Tax=Paracoccus sp. MC1862 TaxID=2760307 RepID=UPI0016018D42|nr:adenosylmethionine--8-amino-7-oxononanoate transaminase [Paracoccus sp. MC1862]MBB1497564.1 adenosylmethionine--8-amino-7-oxononanoate transaminase [Paracoccus sp. MC1862]QQO44013.1 adenosylmethionine--8-amino-7-oxononanoate transaminase [Paracoccus sp. MC1862]
MSDSPVWRPFTQHATEPEPPVVRRTHGAIIETDHGLLIDAISSWWVITHGHSHPPIMQAIREASETLDQVIFAGLTHEPAESLARELVALAPKGLTRVFYSDSGSTSVEVALKMALGFWRNTGRPRHRIAVLQDGYHGDTIGTMSVGERGVFNAAYEPLMFAVDRLPFPEGDGAETLSAFEAMAAGGDMAAIILEPLVLGAGGMRMYDPQVLDGIRRICDRHGVLMIADEVMTGWGRTGRTWACDHAGVSPDILCTSKGLTGGAIPLAATLATEDIFQAHWSEDRSRTFFHSSSYTANPLACAAGLANARIWAADGMQAQLDAVAAMQAERLQAIARGSPFTNARQTGTIAAIDLRVDAAGYLAAVGPRLRAHALDRGVLLRPLGNTVYVMPPYCITADQLDQVWQAIADFAG